jgi:hypothetical protein
VLRLRLRGRRRRMQQQSGNQQCGPDANAHGDNVRGG